VTTETGASGLVGTLCRDSEYGYIAPKDGPRLSFSRSDDQSFEKRTYVNVPPDRLPRRAGTANATACSMALKVVCRSDQKQTARLIAMSFTVFPACEPQSFQCAKAMRKGSWAGSAFRALGSCANSIHTYPAIIKGPFRRASQSWRGKCDNWSWLGP
jgi:hypothetical protein